MRPPQAKEMVVQCSAERPVRSAGAGRLGLPAPAGKLERPAQAAEGIAVPDFPQQQEWVAEGAAAQRRLVLARPIAARFVQRSPPVQRSPAQD